MKVGDKFRMNGTVYQLLVLKATQQVGLFNTEHSNRGFIMWWGTRQTVADKANITPEEFDLISTKHSKYLIPITNEKTSFITDTTINSTS